MRLRARFTVALSALSLLTLLVTGALVLRWEDAYVVRKEREAEASAIEIFARGCAASLRSGDPAALTEYAFDVARAATTARASTLAYAGFFSPEGRPIRETDAAFLGEKVPASVLGSVLKTGGSTGLVRAGLALSLAAAPVLEGSRRAGTALLAFDETLLASRRGLILSNNLRHFSEYALIAFLLSAVFAAYLGAWLARPIRDLELGARRIGEGDLRHRIAPHGQDEIGMLAAEFNEMAQRLQELDRMKEDFLASVTHELRSPMASIIGFSDMLLSGSGGALSAKQEDWTQTIRSSAKRLSGMINNILDSAKLEAGLMEFEREEVPVGELAQEVAESFEPIALDRKVRLDVKADEARPAWADPDSIRQVLTNLVGNALKFTPEGGTVTVETSDSEARVLVRVLDTGPGIPKEAMDKLFSKFFQVKETQFLSKGKGSGLGLSISKGIVEGQGGRIWAESAGRGAVFCFTLPCKPESGDGPAGAGTPT